MKDYQVSCDYYWRSIYITLTLNSVTWFIFPRLDVQQWCVDLCAHVAAFANWAGPMKGWVASWETSKCTVSSIDGLFLRFLSQNGPRKDASGQHMWGLVIRHQRLTASVQTLSLLAYIKENAKGMWYTKYLICPFDIAIAGSQDPHLIVCPLSVLSSWMAVRAKVAPDSLALIPHIIHRNVRAGFHPSALCVFTASDLSESGWKMKFGSVT